MTRTYEPSGRLVALLKFLVLIGGAVMAAGAFLAPERVWPNVLLSAFYVLSLALGAVFFLAIQYVTGAGWSIAFKRVPEAMAGALPVSGLLLLVSLLGAHSLYEWSHPQAVAADPLLQAKHAWLNLPFFSLRAVLYIALWTVIALSLIKASRTQDGDGDLVHTNRSVKLSALFLVVFAVTFSAATFDWIMSLQAHWFSTVFAVYNFAGLFVNALAVITALVIALRRRGPFQGVITEAHLHDLGKLLFAFSTFWAYIWFCQYMLIWYANIPEETTYYMARHSDAWASLSLLSLALNWVVPFLALMSQFVKRNEGVLLKVCAILMVGHWLDLYLQILPASPGSSPAFGVWEIAPFLGILSLFFLVFFRALGQAELIPRKDPLLEESLHHHT